MDRLVATSTLAPELGPPAPAVPPTSSAWTQPRPWPSGAVAAPAPASEGTAPAEAAAARQGAATPHRGSHRLTVSVLVLGAGLAALLDTIGVLDVDIQVAAAIALGVVAATLLLSAWFGRALGLVSLAMLLTVVCGVAAIVDTPFKGGVGDRSYLPVSAPSSSPSTGSRSAACASTSATVPLPAGTTTVTDLGCDRRAPRRRADRRLRRRARRSRSRSGRRVRHVVERLLRRAERLGSGRQHPHVAPRAPNRRGPRDGGTECFMTRHRLDVFPLCAGVLFMVLAIGFLLDGLDIWNAHASWIGPVLLIVFGLAGVLTTVGRYTRPGSSTPSETASRPRQNRPRQNRPSIPKPEPARRGLGVCDTWVGTKRPDTGRSELRRREIRSPAVGAVTERHARPVANAAGQRHAHNRTGEGRAPADRARAPFAAPLVRPNAHPGRAGSPPRRRLAGVRRTPARAGAARGHDRHQRPGVVAGVDDRRVREPRPRPRRAAAGEFDTSARPMTARDLLRSRRCASSPSSGGRSVRSTH